MAISQSLVLYRPSSTSSTLTTTSSSQSLISSRLFTATTGTAIATELLYRILWEIINRLLHSFQSFASARMDQMSSFLERKSLERKERLAKAKEDASKADSLGILEQVNKLNEQRGFDGFACPLTGEKSGADTGAVPGPGPPRWVRGVLKGVDEGRMQDRDFWINTHIG